MRRLLSTAAILLIALTGKMGYAADPQIRPDIAAVHSLYEAFAWEAVLDESDTDKALLEQPRTVLMHYFTQELAALILQDRDCVARTQDVCKLDFMPIWDSQDAGGAIVTLAPGTNLGEVTVKIRYPSHHERKMTFRLKNGSTGWKIADIVYARPDGPKSLSQLLAGHAPAP